MLSSSAIVVAASLLVSAVNAADSLVINQGPTNASHVGDHIPIAYGAPNNEAVTLALVKGPTTNLQVVATIFTGTGSTFTWTPVAPITPDTYALGIYDASTYNFWPYFNLAAATTTAATSNPTAASTTSTSSPVSVQPQSIPPTTASSTSTMPSMTGMPTTSSSSMSTTSVMTTSSASVSAVVSVPMYQNTTLTTTVCNCHHNSTGVSSPTSAGLTTSMPLSGYTSSAATWTPTGTVPSSSMSPTVSMYQGNSGNMNSASGIVTSLGAILVAFLVL